MVKHCPKCGAANEDDADFCSDCGNRFRKPAQEPSKPVQPSVQYGAPPAAYMSPNKIYTTHLSKEEFYVADLGPRCGAYCIDGLLVGVGLCFCLLPGLIYLAFKDGISEGRSVGKKAFNLRVVDAYTGEPCSLNQSWIRNFSGCAITVFFDRYKRQIGDWLAHTIVVEDREVRR